MKQLLFALPVTVLVSCASLPDRMDTMPDYFAGEAAIMTVAGSEKMMADAVKIDDTIATAEVFFGRTARLNAPVASYTMIGLKTTQAEEGDLLVALPFRPPGYGVTSNFSWCRPGNAKVSEFQDFMIGGRQSACFYYSNGSLGLALSRGGSTYFPEGGTIAQQTVEPLQLTELGPDESKIFDVIAKVDSVSSKGRLRMEHLFVDEYGAKTVLFSNRYDPEPDGSYVVDVFDGTVRLEPVGERRFMVTELEAIEGPGEARRNNSSFGQALGVLADEIDSAGEGDE